MYTLSEQQIEYILNDIRRNGIETEDLQLNLLDHICCLIEEHLKENDDFEAFYQQVIKQFYVRNLREIEEETINLLTFKNYYVMKKVMIASGALSAAGFIIGSAFKVFHMPGSGALLILGLLSFSFLFLPLLAILKMREHVAAREKAVSILGIIVGILYTTSILFAINHWDGSTFMWLSTVSVSMFLFIPVYFFTGIRKAETKFNTIITSVILVGATGMLFSMVALRRPTAETVPNPIGIHFDKSTVH